MKLQLIEFNEFRKISANLMIYFAAGRQREAREILRRLEERAKRGFVPAYNLAIIHIALNENDAALKYLQQGYYEHDWAMLVMAVEPRLDPLRSIPSFRELVGKLALPM